MKNQQGSKFLFSKLALIKERIIFMVFVVLLIAKN